MEFLCVVCDSVLGWGGVWGEGGGVGWGGGGGGGW